MQCKESIGSQLSKKTHSHYRLTPVESATFEDSLNLEKEATDTGNCCSCLKENKDYHGSKRNSPLATLNCQEVKPQLRMSGKKTLGLVNPLNTAKNQSTETQKKTGHKLKTGHKVVNLKKSLKTYMFVIITPSSGLQKIIVDQLQEILKSSSIGGVLALANHEELGKRQELIVTLRILEQSGGMATRVKLMLSWMNFEELSISEISLPGSIVIRAEWREKEVRSLWQQKTSGSPPIFTPANGTLTWTTKPTTPLKEE